MAITRHDPLPRHHPRTSRRTTKPSGTARSRSRCPSSSTPGSISSAASARPGRSARTARRTPARRANRRGLHHRGRSALGAGAEGRRDLLPPRRALLDGPGAARPRGAGAAPLRRAARHLRAALAGAAESDRHERGAARQGRGQRAVGGRPRLPRRHAAPRHQAVFRLDRLRSPTPQVGWHADRKLPTEPCGLAKPISHDLHSDAKCQP